ncbi:MAG: SAM-dependent methyltransferase [Clostridia bacterium]|nr:SAM-dependent methyltransferase [Clostridia bacterium]
MPEARLSRRLYAAFLLVEGGVCVADIGTDHGYLPIELVKSGKAPSAIASDINPQPLDKARANIESEGLSSKIELRLTDGAIGLEDRAEELVIAGMGGELIAEIVKKAEFTRKKDFHMVLQPMTKTPELRRWLWNNGYRITCEKYLEDSGHFYTVLSVHYMGENTEYTALDSEIGKECHRVGLDKDEAYALSCEIKLRLYDLNNKIQGKSRAGILCDAETELHRGLSEILSSLERN